MPRIALNGFGRIGRQVFKIARQRGLEIAFINDLTDSTTLAHLLKYDSVHGRYQAEISASEAEITIDGTTYPVLSIKNPAELPSHEVDLMIEGTGAFTDRDKMGLHLQAGAKKVLLTAPAKGEIDATIVMGVNHESLRPEHLLVSNASCTTNCLAPLAYILQREFGIISGFMNTIHSYTNDQNLLDLPHKDLRRARAAAINIVPSSTGAAKTLGLIIPEIQGKLDGLALRVPTPVGSIVDLTCVLSHRVTVEEVNAIFQKYAQTDRFKGILAYNSDPIVSSDIVDNPHSCIFDATLTQIVQPESLSTGSHVKILGWYDNEWGYSNRVVDLAIEMLELWSTK